MLDIYDVASSLDDAILNSPVATELAATILKAVMVTGVTYVNYCYVYLIEFKEE